VALVVFSRTANITFPFDATFSKVELQALIRSQPFQDTNTDPAQALDVVRTALFVDTAGYRAARPIVIVLTDGNAPSLTSLAAVSDSLQTAADGGVEIYAFGVGTRVEQAGLEAIASPPLSEHVYRVADLSPQAVQGLALRITARDICPTLPAGNDTNITILPPAVGASGDLTFGSTWVWLPLVAACLLFVGCVYLILTLCCGLLLNDDEMVWLRGTELNNPTYDQAVFEPLASLPPLSEVRRDSKTSAAYDTIGSATYDGPPARTGDNYDLGPVRQDGNYDLGPKRVSEPYDLGPVRRVEPARESARGASMTYIDTETATRTAETRIDRGPVVRLAMPGDSEADGYMNPNYEFQDASVANPQRRVPPPQSTIYSTTADLV
jgi:hypothetical protein